MSQRPLRPGKQISEGAMRYSPFVDDRGRNHEPVDKSRDYVPNAVEPESEDEGPIPQLLAPSKRRAFEPSVAGDSVDIRMPTRNLPSQGENDVNEPEPEPEPEKHNKHDIKYIIHPHETPRGTDYHIVFSARDLPTETRKVPFEQITKHMRIYSRWVKRSPEDRDEYKDSFGRYLKAKLK